MPAPEREVPLFNPFPKPDQSSYLMPYIEYRDWWTKEQEISEERELRASGRRRPVERLRGERESQEEREKQREKLQASYDEYRENFTGKMTKVFVHQHQTEEWFKEKYDPDVRESYRQTLAGYRRESYIRWSDDLQAGTFDDFSLEGIYKGDSNGIGGVIEKEEGETTGAAEVQAVSDLVPAKGADLRDEAAMQPALLIKTLAAQIQRHKIEAFCKEHLGEGPGGYRWLSLGDPNPAKKFTRVGWVLLHPEEGDTEITNGKERSDGREEDEENGDGEMDGAETKEAPKTYVDLAFSQIDGKTIEDEVKGNFTCHFGIHSPHSAPRKKALWDLMSAPERIERDLQWATRLALKLEQELGSEVDGVNSIENHVENLRGEGRLKSASNGVTSGGKPLRILGEEAESGEDDYMEEGEEEVDSDEVDDEELLVNKKKLDLLVEYLRRVFNFCFFCVVEADSVIDLERKCSGGHLRRPRAGLTALAKTCAQATVNKEPFPLKKQKGSDDQDTKQEDGPMKTENDELPSPVAERQPRFNRRNNTHMQLQKAFSWVTRYEDMLRQVVEPETVDVKKLGARPVDEALEEDLKEFRKAEDDRYRCKIAEDCKKMFKAEHFWRKHVEKRHTEWLEGMKKEVSSWNIWLLVRLALLTLLIVDCYRIFCSGPQSHSRFHCWWECHGPQQRNAWLTAQRRLARPPSFQQCSLPATHGISRHAHATWLG